VWPPFSIAGIDHPCAGPKVHLGFFSRRTLRPAEGQLLLPAPLPDKALDALVAAREAMIGSQVLPGALGRQADLLFQEIVSGKTPSSSWRHFN